MSDDRYQIHGDLTLHGVTRPVVLDATYFASARHRDQRRQDRHASPFVNHPIETAMILASAGGIRSTPILVGAVLHDIVEDTRTTLGEIEARFGSGFV